MVDFEELAQAMGDLDEDTMTEMLAEVMSDGGSQAQQAAKGAADGRQPLICQ